MIPDKTKIRERMSFRVARAAEGESLPTSKGDIMAAINGKLPDGADPLTLKDVYVHYLEAANNSFMSDRYGFMGESTLQNIAADAVDGFAFQNSHRTGRFGAELPLGRTFGGEMIQDAGKTLARVGVYMKRNHKPNGDSGPSTDQINDGIMSGTIWDVSVGLNAGGDFICDVCSQDLFAFNSETGDFLCPHIPGTHRGMSPDQIASQVTRGVTKGRASYSLENFHCGEVSVVYDGAVPGAGFHKAVAVSPRMSADEMSEAREVFAASFETMDKFKEIAKMAEDQKPSETGRIGAFMQHMKSFFTAAPASEPPAVEPAAVTDVVTPPPSTEAADALASENAALKAELDRINAEREAEAKTSADALKAEQDARAKEAADRAKAQTSSFAKSLTNHGAEARRTFEGLYHGATSGTLTLRREKADAPKDATDEEKFETLTAGISPEASAILTSHLESLAKMFPPVGAKERHALGGKEVDAAAGAAGGDADDDPKSIHFEALARVKKLSPAPKDNSPEFAKAYETELAAVRKEKGVNRGA